jgi:hypothetical protein
LPARKRDVLDRIVGVFRGIVPTDAHPVDGTCPVRVGILYSQVAQNAGDSTLMRAHMAATPVLCEMHERAGGSTGAEEDWRGQWPLHRYCICNGSDPGHCIFIAFAMSRGRLHCMSIVSSMSGVLESGCLSARNYVSERQVVVFYGRLE